MIHTGINPIANARRFDGRSARSLVVLHAQDASAILNKLVERDIVTSTRRDGARFSFHVYNTMDDVNAALTVLEDNLEFMVRS